MVIVQYSHTEDVDEDGLDDDALTKPLSRVKFEHFNDPSFRNYRINTSVELRQSFLLELRDQHTFSSTEVTGSL